MKCIVLTSTESASTFSSIWKSESTVVRFWTPSLQSTTSSLKSMTSEKVQKTSYKNMKCYGQYAAKSFPLKTQELVQQKVVLKITMPSQATQDIWRKTVL